LKGRHFIKNAKNQKTLVNSYIILLLNEDDDDVLEERLRGIQREEFEDVF